MTISSLSSTSLLQPSSISTRQAKNPLEDALSNLETELASGNKSSASSLVTDILSHSPNASSSNASADTESDNPVDKIDGYLKSIQSAIQSGDTESAASALSSLQDYMAANPPPQPPNGGGAAGGIDGGNPLKKALDSLSSDLTSGDTEAAASVLSDIVAHTQNDTSDDTFSDLLKSLTSSISSGDATNAQSILSSLQEYLASSQPASAAGIYSADGSFTSDSTQSTALSAMA